MKKKNQKSELLKFPIEYTTKFGRFKLEIYADDMADAIVRFERQHPGAKIKTVRAPK